MTKPKTSTLNHLRETADRLKELAGIVRHHIHTRRVTHTAKSMRNLVDQIVQVAKGLEDERAFFKRCEFGLYQSQVGPTEVRLEKNGKDMFIQGTFEISSLREFFVV